MTTSINPFESPALHRSESSGEPTCGFSLRQWITDGIAGVMVGGTYGSLGGVFVLATRWIAFETWMPSARMLEQSAMLLISGALGGTLIGMAGGTLVSLGLSFVFRTFRLEKTITCYWTTITRAAVVGSLAGFGGGWLLTAGVGDDAMSMVWYPLGAVIGGMIGALAGRQWIRLAIGEEVSPFHRL